MNFFRRILSMSERRNWVERNIFHQHQPQPWERVRYQVEEDKPITGRIEVYTGHGLQKVGMGQELWEQSSIVREIYASAERASGFPDRTRVRSHAGETVAADSGGSDERTDPGGRSQ